MKKTILIIDDNKIIAYALSKMFDEGAFNVIAVNDAKSGIEKCLSIKPDVVITDIEMPQTSGLDVIHAIRIELAKPIILAMSSRSSNRELALQLGANHFFVKPVTVKDILGCLN